MKRLIIALGLLLFSAVPRVTLGQASPYNLNIFKSQSFTATGQTGVAIQLNGLTPGSSTVGSSFASGNITVTGVSLTTASFQVMGSSDNGATFFPLPIATIATPSATPTTTVTVTASGLYQVSLAGITHIKFVTTGTFTATSVSFILTGSPNALTSRNGGSGGGGTPSALGVNASDSIGGPFRTAGSYDLIHTGDSSHPAFFSTQATPNYYLNTLFNEGSSGATLQGTTPATFTGTGTWQLGPGVTWNFSSNQGVVSGGGTSLQVGAIIDIAHSDYACHFSVTSVGGGYMNLFLRYTDATNNVFLSMNGVNSARLFDYSNGNLTQLAAGSLNFQNLNCSVSGGSISFTDGRSTLSGTITDNLTATKIGFGINAPATGASVASMSVSGAPSSTTVACAGFPNADGTCSGTGTNALVAFDPNQHLVALPEVQINTDFFGTAAIGCQEDYSKGKFDVRCTKYGGGLLTHSNDAMQAVSDAMTCYQATTGRHASTEIPSGDWFIGTVAYPTLMWPAGAFTTGIPNGIGQSTVLHATYNNHRAFQINTGHGAICSDGHLHTNPLTAGVTQYLAEYGCGTGTCVNVPGDTGSYPNGGPLQDGIFIGDSQGDINHIAALNNGGTGIECGGQDSHCSFFQTQLNNEWYLYGKEQPGQVYDPATDGFHADILLSSIDGQFDHMEPYGTYGQPGREYGHLVLIAWGGGNSSLSDVFAQVGQIGILRGNNGGFGHLTHSRLDYMLGESILAQGGSNDSYEGLTIDGYCQYASIVTQLGGYCDGIDNRGEGNYYSNVLMSKTNGQVSTSYATGDIYAFNGLNLGTGTEKLKIDNPSSYYHGQSVNKTFFHSVFNTVGDNPDVGVFDTISPQDSSPITICGVSNAFIGQDVWVVQGNKNVTLGGPASGCHWHTNNNADLNLGTGGTSATFGSGFLHFKVLGGTIYGTPAEMVEQSDPANRIAGHFNFGSNTPPARALQATVDALGSIFARPQGNLPNLVLTTNSPATTYNYCTAMMVKAAGGTLTTNHGCSNNPPAVNNAPSGYVYVLNELIPDGWQHYETYFDTNDPSMSNLNGLLDQADATGDLGQAFTYGFKVTTDTTTPINTNPIGLPYNLNTTGGLGIQRAVPSSSSEQCQDREMVFGGAPASGGTSGWYLCHPANVWTYYAQVPTTTSW